MYACFEKEGLAVALNFFVFSDARVMLITLRRALFVGCELGFSCRCVCVMEWNECYM